MHAVFKENQIGIVQPAFGHIFVTKYYKKRNVIVIIFICNVILTAAALQSKSWPIMILGLPNP